MTQAVEHVLEEFDRLDIEDRRDAFLAIIDRAAQFDHPPLDDETLAQIADESFQEYDAREKIDALNETR